MQKIVLLLFSSLMLLLLNACGMEYKKFSTKIKTHIEDNQSYKFGNLDSKGTNYLLYSQEAGLFNFLQNDPSKSLGYFNNAITDYNIIEQSSKLSSTKALSFAFLSDTLIKYEGSDYERGLVHYYAAFNYLQNNDLNDADIEFKAAELNQKFAAELRLKKIIASEQKINSFLDSNNLQSKDIQQALQESRDMRAKAQDKFLNANLLYTAGIVRELNHETNDAYVDYKQAFTLAPNNSYILNDLYRLSLRFDQSYAVYLAKNHPSLAKLNFNNYNNQKTIYLIYEQGFIPQRKNLKISLIGVDNLVLSINIPIYSAKFKANIVNLNLDEDDNSIASSLAQQDVNLYLLAKNNLVEQYPIIIARQVTKLATQIVSQKALQKYGGQNGNLLAFGVGITSLFDSSDTRSWRLLPNYVQVAKINTNQKFNNIKVQINDNKVVVTLPNIQLNPKQIAIVYVFDSGKTIYSKLLYKGSK